MFFFIKNPKTNLIKSKNYSLLIKEKIKYYPFNYILSFIKNKNYFTDTIYEEVYIIVPDIIKNSIEKDLLFFIKYLKIKIPGFSFKLYSLTELFTTYFFDKDFLLKINKKFFFFIYADFFFLDYSCYIDFYTNNKIIDNDIPLLLKEELGNLDLSNEVLLEISKKVFDNLKKIDKDSVEDFYKSFNTKDNDFINIFLFLSILNKEQFLLYSYCICNSYNKFLKNFHKKNHLIDANNKLEIFLTKTNKEKGVSSKISFKENKEGLSDFYLFLNKYSLNINIDTKDIINKTLYINISLESLEYNKKKEINFSHFIFLSKIIYFKILYESSIKIEKIVFNISKTDLLFTIKNNKFIRKKIIPIIRSNNFFIDVKKYEKEYKSIDFDFLNFRLKIINFDIKIFKIFYIIKLFLLRDSNFFVALLKNQIKNLNIEEMTCSEIFSIFSVLLNSNKRNIILDENSNNDIKIISEVFNLIKAFFIEYKKSQEQNIILFGKNKDGYMEYIKSLDNYFCLLIKDFFISLDKIQLKDLNKNEKIQTLKIKEDEIIHFLDCL